MSGRFSLHVGVNKVDPAHYGSDAPLRGCENDARDMQSIASALGYQTDILLTENATSRNFLERLTAASRALVSGDTFLLTLACHGSQVKDALGEEDDGDDETWCLFDRMILDDEAFNAFNQFRRGVRIFVLSDSCHSGTVTRAVVAAQKANNEFLRTLNIEADTIFRCIDPYLEDAVFSQFQPIYDAIKFAIPRSRSRSATGPDVVLISGCQDGQLSGDGARNGFFTENLKAVWNDGGFQGTHRAFRQRISDRMNTPIQVPNLFSYGPTADSFIQERPFAMNNSQSRDINDGSGMTENMVRCHLEIPEQLVRDLQPEEVKQFIVDNCVGPLSQVCTGLLEMTPQMRATRGSTRGDASVSCKADSGGKVSCEGKVSWSF